MLLFMPPARPIVSLANPVEGTVLANRLLSRYHPHDRSPNLYRLANGTYTEIEPWDHQWEILYLGGHMTPVTDKEVEDLIDAGYETGITLPPQSSYGTGLYGLGEYGSGSA